MKTENISLRVSTELKQKLETISEESGLTNSQIIRPLLEQSLIKPEIIPLGDGRFYNTVTDHDLINSLEFTELIFWIYDKRREPRRDENDEFYKHLLNVILKVKQSKLFSIEFHEELDKVQKEIELALKNEYIYEFTFPSENGFNYLVLFTAVHMIRFNSDNDQIIPFK